MRNFAIATSFHEMYHVQQLCIQGRQLFKGGNYSRKYGTYFSNNFEIHLLSTNLHLYQNLPKQGLEKLRCMIFGTHLLTVQGTFSLKDRVAFVSFKNIQITCFRVFHG